jgi:hypothetical protein
MTEPDDISTRRIDHGDVVAAPSGGVGAAVAWAAAWLAAEGGVTAALMLSGVAPYLAEAAAIALAVTTPVALGLGWALFDARLGAAQLRAEALSRTVRRPDADPARAGRMAAEALRAALAETDIVRSQAASLEGQARLEARLEALIARLDDTGAPAHARVMAEPIVSARSRAAAAATGFADAPAPRPARPPAATAIPAQTAAQTPMETAPAPTRKPTPPEDPQRSLPLTDAEPAGAAPRDWSLIARALDFPRDADDAEGFAALAAAVTDPLVSELLQAAEDTLTLLAQHNVYMEDLRVSPASPEDWAAFINGARGPAVAAVGGVQEAEAIDTVRALNRHDAIFRDTAMHLMRRYDAMMRRALDAPSGAHRLPQLADTRTGRAYMLTARAVGAFD